MAYIQPRKNKNGQITSWTVKIHKGIDKATGRQLKPFTATFKYDAEKTPRQNEKALNAFIADFEKKCKYGIADSRQIFSEYAEYVLDLKQRQGVKRRTIELYRVLLPRINEAIGYMKITDIRPQHLNALYAELLKNGSRSKSARATAKADIRSKLKAKGLTFTAVKEQTGIALNTISVACQGKTIMESKAQQIADVIGEPVTSLFTITKDETPLSNKTVIEYHRLISTVLAQADKELLIPYNPASKATPPKLKHKDANYFEYEDIEKMLECLEREPLKWKVIVHLLIITGCRRGEIAGLKWDVVDWKNNRLHICRNLLYSTQIGVYEDTTKTEQSDRYITLPSETMELLKEYRRWYLLQVQKFGSLWHNENYLFVQEKTDNAGKPMNPDTINSYLNSFSKRYDLPHINPHAFRHTQASILFFNGVDSVSISKRLGHSKVSTTSDIYSHIIKEADKQSAECVANVLLRPKHIDIDRRKASDE